MDSETADSGINTCITSLAPVCVASMGAQCPHTLDHGCKSAQGRPDVVGYLRVEVIALRSQAQRPLNCIE